MTGSAWFAAAFVTAAYVLLKALARTHLLNDPDPTGEPSTALQGGAVAVPRTPAGSGRGSSGVTAGETAPTSVLRRNP